MAQHTGDWWMRSQQPITGDSTIAGSEIGGAVIGSSAVADSLAAYIPGAAVISLSSHTSNDEQFASIQLNDLNGNAYARKMPVRVYIGSTADAGSAVSSTSLTSFTVAASATSSGSNVSYTLGGIVAATHLANVDYDFLASSAGLLTLSMVLTTDNASTDALHVIWAGGAYRSSDTIGGTAAAS